MEGKTISPSHFLTSQTLFLFCIQVRSPWPTQQLPLKDKHLTGFYDTSEKGSFTSQRFPLSYITLCHLLCDPWDHHAVVFNISIAESIPCLTCGRYLYSQFTDGKRGRERVASFSGQLRAQAESQCWQPACHRWAQDRSTPCGTLSFVTPHLSGKKLMVSEVSTTPFLRKCCSSHCIWSVFRFHG